MIVSHITASALCGCIS